MIRMNNLNPHELKNNQINSVGKNDVGTIANLPIQTFHNPPSKNLLTQNLGPHQPSRISHQLY